MPFLSSFSDETRSENRNRPTGGLTTIGGTLGLVLAVVVVVQASWESKEERSKTPKVGHRAVLNCRDHPIFTLAWSPDGRKLAASNFGPVVRIWDQETGAVSLQEGVAEQPRFVLGWTEDGRKIAVGGLEVPVETLDVSDAREESRRVVRPTGRASQVEALGRFTRGKSIRLWGPADSRLAMLPAAGRESNCIAFSTDGRFMASGDSEGILRIWDSDTSEVRHSVKVADRGITGVAFSPDGSMAATGGCGPVQIWDVVSGKPVASLGKEWRGSVTLAFSPDGEQIAAAAWDGSIQIWNLKTDSRPTQLRGHHGQILTLAWSPDGKTLASGGYDSTVRLWDVGRSAGTARSDR